MPSKYPYTVTNSYKGGFFMRTYSRNVRRTWDGEDYHAPKRQRLENYAQNASFLSSAALGSNIENLAVQYDIEDNLERAIRETSVAALSSSPSRQNSTVFSYNEPVEDVQTSNTITPPSSPPPQQALQVTPPVIKSRKPTFSIIEKKKKREKEKEAGKEKEKEREKEKPATDKRKRDEDMSNGEGGDEVKALGESEPFAEIFIRELHSSVQASTPYPIAESLWRQLFGLPMVDIGRTDAAAKPLTMTQTILDFGQSTTPITCQQCEMSYTPSVAEDSTLHSMYHNRHSFGIELSKAFTKSAMRWCYEVAHIRGSVVVVDRKISLPGRRTVQNVLEVVNKELGSIAVPEAELWGQRHIEGEPEDGKKADRYKVFLHVVDGKCVGVCLAERISKAFRVKAVEKPQQSIDLQSKEKEVSTKEDGALLTPTSSSAPSNSLTSSADLELELESVEAVVGVSRIWTSKNFRRKGIANNLLDCVMTQFIYGMDIPREQVAFSQPTDMGSALAKGWFGEDIGWLVYHEK